MTQSRLIGSALAAALLALASQGDAQEASVEPIRYVLRFDEAKNHYLDVEASFPVSPGDGDGDDAGPVELMMAVWTPGSYLVREFSRHVEDVRALSSSGAALAVEKTTKNRWVVEPGDEPRVTLHYRVYCHEMTVRTNWIEADFAILNGAPTFVTLVDGHHLPHEVNLKLPREWAGSFTAMPRHPDEAAHHYRAPDYDTLVDSPIYAGSPAVYRFTVDGVPHTLVNHGEGGVWDGPRSARDVQTLVEQALSFWGQLPYEEYVFLNMITEAGGGLEHKSSTLMMTSRWRSRVPKDYRRWLGLVSHEYFHAWNVKRFRPAALGPFDYEREVYSKSLWVAEGVTSYYDDLLLKRAGLLSKKQYLDALSEQIESLQRTPGRRVRPLELASFDSWIRAYRPDENSRNATISYYTKGAVVAFLLDARIRRATDGERSLDDVMRMGYELYSGERGYTPEELRALASEVAGEDLTEFFVTALETTEELDYAEALDWYGLRFERPDADPSDRSGKSKGKASIGADTHDEGGRLVVSRVLRDSRAYAAGLNVGDELVALNGYRLTAAVLDDRLEQYEPGESVTLTIARREELMELALELDEKPSKSWCLELDPDARYEQRKRLEAWLTRSTSSELPER